MLTASWIKYSEKSSRISRGLLITCKIWPNRQFFHVPPRLHHEKGGCVADMMGHLVQRTDSRGQRTEDRGQRTEDRGQMLAAGLSPHYRVSPAACGGFLGANVELNKRALRQNSWGNLMAIDGLRSVFLRYGRTRRYASSPEFVGRLNIKNGREAVFPGFFRHIERLEM